MKYLDLISQDETDNKKEEKQFANEDAKIHVAGHLNETEKALSSAKRDLLVTQKAIPYDLQNEINATIALSDLETAKTLAKKIIAERF